MDKPDREIKDEMDTVISEEQIERILRAAGSRMEPPVGMADAVKENVRAVWQEEVARKKRNKFQKWGLAASVTLAISVGVWQWTDSTQAKFATLDRVINEVSVSGDGTHWTPSGTLDVAEPMEIKTGVDSLASVTMSDGVNLRIAADSHVEIFNEDRVQLKEGRIYIDSHKPSGVKSTEIAILTDYGIARDIGTQFEVSASQEGWQVRVREGRVVVSDDDLLEESAQGSVIRISKANEMTQSQVSPGDASWDWTQKVTPEYSIENKSVDEYLQWVARETGQEVHYENEFTQWTASNIRLHGSIEGISPEQSLSMVLATTELKYLRTEQGAIFIKLH